MLSKQNASLHLQCPLFFACQTNMCPWTLIFLTVVSIFNKLHSHKCNTTIRTQSLHLPIKGTHYYNLRFHTRSCYWVVVLIFRIASRLLYNKSVERDHVSLTNIQQLVMVYMTKEYDFLLKETDSASACRSLNYTVLPLQIQVCRCVACIYIGRQKSE